MSPQQRQDAEQKDKILAKSQRVSMLVTLLDMHTKKPTGQQDAPYINGLRYRLSKARNELRNMTGVTL